MTFHLFGDILELPIIKGVLKMKKQTKKVVALFTVIMLLFSVSCIAVSATEADYEWSEKDGKAVITKYVGTDKEVNVPDTLGGLPVTEIGGDAFGYTYIEKIELPDTIEKISDHAFRGCNFTSFEIPPKVTEISDYTFVWCYLLEDIKMHNGIKSIGTQAFKDCDALKEFVIPDSVEKLGDAVFYSCSGLESIVISENIDEIPLYTFFYCINLKDVELHNSITSIGEAAFYQCAALEQIELPAELTLIGSRAFGICKSLKEISIPESVEVIEQGAFRECDALEKIVINNPDCNIYDDVLTIHRSAVIYGAKGSEAEKYADMCDREFVELKPRELGDVDGNLNITAADARLALRISARIQVPDETQKTYADIDKNGKVTAADARIILRIAARLE